MADVEELTHMQEEIQTLKKLSDVLFDRLAKRDTPEAYPLEEVYADKEKIIVILENLTSKVYCSGIAELSCKSREDKKPEEIEQLKKDIELLEETRKKLFNQATASLKGLQQ